MSRFKRFKTIGLLASSNGKEAVEYLTGNTPSLILMDVNMPVMDGFTFRVHQQLDPSLADVPVVLVSGAANLPDEAIRLGVVDYVQKPADPMEKETTAWRKQ